MGRLSKGLFRVIALAGAMLLGGCAMQNSEYGKNVEQAVLAEADAWLAGAGETDYSLGACTPKEGSWYAVEVDGGERGGYRVFVRLTADGAEVRDDRVLSALGREMTALAGESAPEEALCAAWVSFAAGMPARAWAPGSGLEEVAAEDALRTDWYLLTSDPDELAAAGADLVLEMSGRGYTGTLHAGVVSEERLALLQATQPQRADLLEDAGLWVRVKSEEERSREELEADIRAGIQD